MVVRNGDGSANLNSNAVKGDLLEVNPSTGATVQTIPLPTVSPAPNSGACTFRGGFNFQMHFTSVLNKGLAIGCE